VRFYLDGLCLHGQPSSLVNGIHSTLRWQGDNTQNLHTVVTQAARNLPRPATLTSNAPTGTWEYDTRARNEFNNEATSRKKLLNLSQHKNNIAGTPTTCSTVGWMIFFRGNRSTEYTVPRTKKMLPSVHCRRNNNNKHVAGHGTHAPVTKL